MNLIQNANKFTKDGSIRIQVALVREDENTQWIRFEVKDTGIGIAEEDQETLFQPYVQTEKAVPRNTKEQAWGYPYASLL